MNELQQAESLSQLFRAGQHDVLINQTQQQLHMSPQDGLAWKFLGIGLIAKGQCEEGAQALKKAEIFRPNDLEIHMNLGIVFNMMGRFSESEQSCRRALVIDSNQVEVYQALGVSLSKQGRDPEAEACLRRATEINPNFVSAHNNLAAVLRNLGRPREAIDVYQKVLQLEPNNIDGYTGLGVNLFACNAFRDAELVFRKTLSLAPDNLPTLINLGVTLEALGKRQEAILLYMRALELDPGYPDAHHNLGVSLYNDAKFGEAESRFRTVIAINPAYSQAYNYLGNTLRKQGRVEEAERVYRYGLQRDPKSPAIGLNLGYLELLRGNFKEGFKHYEARLALPIPDYTIPITKLPQWTGQAVGPNEGLIVYWEQGLGDIIQCLRFFPILKKRFARVRFVTSPIAERLVRANVSADIEVLSAEKTDRGNLDETGYQWSCLMMSLPFFLEIQSEQDIPNTLTYMRVLPEWTQALRLQDNKTALQAGQTKKKRIGLLWSGGKQRDYTAERDMPLKYFQPILQNNDVEWVNIVFPSPEEEIALIRYQWNVPIEDPMGRVEDIAGTAALISSLDGLISVDTAAAHMGGALGKPVWMLNRFDMDWRWLRGRKDSAWYPSVRVITQPVYNDWDSVIKELQTYLNDFLK